MRFWIFFYGNNIIKQKKVNVFGYLVCVTKLVGSRNWSVFNFNHNDTDIKYFFNEKETCTFMSNQGGASS